MAPRYFLAATGEPFADRDAAALKRDDLARELGDPSFEVVPHPSGGFAVVRVPVSDPENEPPPISGVLDLPIPEGPGDVLARAREHAHETPTAQDAPAQPARAPALEDAPASVAAGPTAPAGAHGEFGSEFVLTAAPRAFLHRFFFMGLGALLVVMPSVVLLPTGPMNSPATHQFILQGAQLFGLLLALWNTARFLTSYLFYRYRVTEQFVEARYGIFSREAPTIYFAHVRSTTVEQALWERLVGVGTVRVGTGATDEHEVNLYHVASPQRLERELQRRHGPHIPSGRHTATA